MWEFYNDKTIFLTGGTGLIGTALLHRLFTKATPRRVFLLLRGGAGKASATWSELLSDDVSKSFIQTPRITIVSGDLKSANLGLSETDWECVKESVNIVIHTASPINLVAGLERMSQLVIGPAMFLADIAFQMPHLEKFVFVSTAYSNAHLWSLGTESDILIKECFYSLDDDSLISEPQKDSWKDIANGADKEWFTLKNGEPPAHWEAFDFPWAYGYAKNLTERLLVQKFGERDALNKFLIVRPSIIGPAKAYPFPGYSRPSSVPAAGFSAAVLLSWRRKFNFASRASNPLETSTLDEVPVDVVVDRLLAHVACGSAGVVHAVSGKADRMSFFGYVFPEIVKERRFPWSLRPVCISSDWNSGWVDLANRIFKLIGTSFDFEEGQTERLSDSLDSMDKADLVLFSDGHSPKREERRADVRTMGLLFGKKQHIPSFIVKLLFHKGRQEDRCVPLPLKSNDIDEKL